MGTILGFHSVTTGALPAGGDAHVPLEFFKRAVRLAQRMGTLVPLDELVRRHARGRSTAGLIALTLDDAYAALQGEFADFVAEQRVPISVFVVSDATRSGEAFWWDRIDDAFPHVSPGRWRAFETACGLPDEYRRHQPADFGPLRPLRQWILGRYAGRWPATLGPALEALEADAGSVSRHRPMNLAELARFASLETVSLGVHTVSHPVLPLLPDDELRREIVECYDALRMRFDRVLPILAFPFALYDRRSVEIARASGMTAGLTLAGTTVKTGSDVGALPRICLTKRDTIARLGMRLLGLPDAARTLTRRRMADYPDLPSVNT